MDTGNTVRVSGGGGIGLGTLAWIALIVLKITGYIQMSWFWVITGFIWIPLGLFVGFLILIGFFVFIWALISMALDR